MKKIIFALTFITMTMSSFTEIDTHSKIEIASEALAHKLAAALQFSSSQQFNQLFPSLREFHLLMDSNEAFYGSLLSDAKLDFAIEYQSKIVPQLNEVFSSLKMQGEKNGIDWNTVKPVRWESKSISDDVISFELTLTSNGKEFKVCIEKTLLINDQLYISQFAKLV